LFPQPAKKQNSSHNPALFRPWISSHKHKKGILDTPVLLCSGMPESLYFKHFSAFHYVFFVIKTTVSTWHEEMKPLNHTCAGKRKLVHWPMSVRKIASRNISTICLFVRNIST